MQIALIRCVASVISPCRELGRIPLEFRIDREMASDRKSTDDEKKKKNSRKRGSSLSASEDEGKHRKRHRKEKEEEIERRSRKSDKKEKRKDKKSHKEKKSKDKHKDKHHKGNRNVNLEELSNDDYFAKNNEFSTWLKEEKGVFFSDLKAESAREMFSDFVKAWNNQKLDSRYYEGISKGPRSAHNWSFKK